MLWEAPEIQPTKPTPFTLKTNVLEIIVSKLFREIIVVTVRTLKYKFKNRSSGCPQERLTPEEWVHLNMYIGIDTALQIVYDFTPSSISDPWGILIFGIAKVLL